MAFDRDAETLARLGEFAALESRCCPFLDFSIHLGAGEGVAWLEISGREGVKAFLKDEFSLGR